MRLTVHPQSPLLYPSDGWFPLVAEPKGRGCAFAIGIPLSERHAFIGVPSSVEPERTEHWSANQAGFVSNYSVGHRSRRVVVHPTVIQGLSEAQIIDAIRGSREGVTRAVQLCGELAGIVRRMDATFST
jgi:hypothetical protein